MPQDQCEYCFYFQFDDETEEYCCSMTAMDEDDVGQFYSGKCPYFRFGDGYDIARKQ